MAVYTHLVLLSDEKFPEPTLEEVIAETRQTYGGPLVVGEDLMSFEIGDTVTVQRYRQ
jgi:ribonuclease Z